MFEFASRTFTLTDPDVPASSERPSRIRDTLRALHLSTSISTASGSETAPPSLDSPNHSISDTGSEHARSGPSHVAWIDDQYTLDPSLDVPIIGRSASSPQSRPSPSFTANRLAKLYVHHLSRSTHSLRLDSRSAWGPEDGYYFPGVKPLSPIAEQDYFSPERRSLPLPVEQISQASTPNGSQYSGITRPSPVYSAFLSRPLNRTHSQNSSRTHISTSSAPPSIPPLDLRPIFPSGQPLRTSKSATLRTMPTINGILEDTLSPFDDGSSLRAESFMTAHSVDNPAPSGNIDHVIGLEDGYTDRHQPGGSQAELSLTHSIRSVPRSEMSSSSSFFDRRWRRSESMGSGLAMASFPKVHKSRFGVSMTPAKWLFWLGFIAPWCWMIGGWYYTIRGERRPKLSGKKNPILPTWIIPKKKVDDGAQLNEKDAVIHGVWFGYPFVLVSDEADLTRTSSGSSRTRGSPPTIRAKERKILDPWIFRCRVAAMTSGVILIIAFVVAFIVIGKYG